jgi:hypothetical protein
MQRLESNWKVVGIIPDGSGVQVVLEHIPTTSNIVLGIGLTSEGHKFINNIKPGTKITLAMEISNALPR